MRHDPTSGRDFDAEFDRLVGDLDVPPVYWQVTWGFPVSDKQQDAIDNLIDEGWKFPCDTHADHDIDVALDPTHMLIRDHMYYGRDEVRELALALERIVGVPVHFFPLVDAPFPWDQLTA